MLQAVLFDLDGTLLDIDLPRFLRVYFGALGPVLAEMTGLSSEQAIAALMDATRSMMTPHPDRTNRQAFDERFQELTGADLAIDRGSIADFYGRVFPSLGDGIGPMPGAREAVDAALEADLRVAVATNPIFPAQAVRERLRWAGLADVPFDLVTTYEHMHACKPEPEYFLEVAGLLEVAPEDCLMVGDDPALDLAAADVGMTTYFTGAPIDERADHTGDLLRLRSLLASGLPMRD